jgi:hypothetical protein
MRAISVKVVLALAATIVVASCSSGGVPGASSTSSDSTEEISAASDVSVTITGGFETDPEDGGRPVALVAAILGVPPEVFREAFSHVTPAAAGEEPDPAQVNRNKAALLAVLAPYGVTNETLDRASNYYRYNGSAGETWPRVQATAQAVVTNGRVTGVTITNPGAGYTSIPTVTVSSAGGVTLTATVQYTADVATNGSLSAITVT